jgi:CheY-like chemotaxis protein
MGERILREEGYEVVSVTDGNTALLRLDDVDPDLILADVFLPSKSGIEICRFVKSHPKHRHVKIIATAGLLEQFDEEEARQAGADAIIKKPFEASVMIATIKPLIVQAHEARSALPSVEAAPSPEPAATVERVSPRTEPAPPVPEPAIPTPEPKVEAAQPKIEEVVTTTSPVLPADAERVRAAVTIALDAAMPALIDELTAKVLLALRRTEQ